MRFGHVVVRQTALLCRLAWAGRLAEARAVFDAMPRRTTPTWNAILSAYSRAGRLDEARHLFDEMPHRNVISWTTLVIGLSRRGCHGKALRLFIQMARDDHLSPPGPEAMAAALHACLGLRLFRLCRQVHARAVTVGAIQDDKDNDDDNDDPGRRRLHGGLIQAYARLGPVDGAAWLFRRHPARETACWNAMIFGYSRAGEIDEARRWFETVPYPDKITVTTMVTAYFDAGDITAGLELFGRQGNRDVVAWTAALSGLVQNELVDEAMGLFREMMAAGAAPSDRTLAALFGGAGSAASLDMGRQLHGLAERTRSGLDTVAGNALVAMYAKCGDAGAAMRAFSWMPVKDVVSWNAVIVGMSHHGRAAEALRLFREMPMQPDGVSFLGAIQACSQTGMTQLGGEILGAMAGPRAEHYACMAHALGRRGQAAEAEELLLRLPTEPGVAAWGALLASCDENDAAVAVRVARRVLELDPGNELTKMRLGRLLKEEAGQRKKAPGMSWVVIRGRAHAFVCGDSSHPMNEEIRALLGRLQF